MVWIVTLTPAVRRKKEKLPIKIQEELASLLIEIEKNGPIRKNWPNFGTLSKSKKKIPENSYHCHLKKGRPTYVACWAVEDKQIKIIEVFYVGTHEDAPY